MANILRTVACICLYDQNYYRYWNVYNECRLYSSRTYLLYTPLTVPPQNTPTKTTKTTIMSTENQQQQQHHHHHHHHDETDSPQTVSKQTKRPSRFQPPGCPQPPQPPGCPAPPQQQQKQTCELQTAIDESIDSVEMHELVTDTTPLTTSRNRVSSSRLSIKVHSHSLRWNRHTNKPRYTAHAHKLRLVHTSNIYKHCSGGRFMCDIHGGDYQSPAYVFHCPICYFDICLECVAQPCLNCSSQTCYHNQITIDLL